MKSRNLAFFLFIAFLLLTGCGSGSGNGSRSDLFPDYGPHEGDIVTIEISSPEVANGGTGGTGTSGNSGNGGNDGTDGGNSSGDTGGTGTAGNNDTGNSGSTGNTGGTSGTTGTSGYQKTAILDEGETLQLSIVAYDIYGKIFGNVEVKWTSDNPDVATVDNKGVVTGVSPGKAAITAELRMGDSTLINDKVVVTVLPSPVTDKKWVNAGVAMPQPMWDHASAIWNGYLYVAGGNSSCDSQSQDCGFTKKVYYAPINPDDGSTGEFIPTTSLPRTLRGHSMLAYNDYLYIIGGIVQPQFIEPPFPDPANFQTVLNEKVYYAHINPDGMIGEWMETSPISLPDLPEDKQDKAGLFALSATVHNGYIYVTGGWNVELKKNVRTLLVGPINNLDGSIMKWLHNNNSDLPYDLSKHASVAANIDGDNYLYIIGGNSGSIGSQSFHREIYYAKIAYDGFPYDWRPASNILPIQLIDHAAVVTDRYIYVLGGRDGDDSGPYHIYPEVYYYFIKDGGDLEPVKRYTPIPTPLFHHAAVADKSSANIYITGGAGGDTEKQENRMDRVYYTNTSP